MTSVALGVSAFMLSRGLGRSCPPPFDGLEELFTLLDVQPSGAAIIRSGTEGRFDVAVYGETVGVVAKVGAPDDHGLRNEAATLTRLGARVGSISVPRLRWHGAWRDQFVVATEIIEATGGGRDLSLDEALKVCVSLARDAGEPVLHGDFAPWNVIRTDSGLALVDWEASAESFVPMVDLCHMVLAIGALLRRHSPATAVQLLTAAGSVGRRYLEAIGADPLTAPQLVRQALMRPSQITAATVRYRQAMMERLNGDTPGSASTPSVDPGADPAISRISG